MVTWVNTLPAPEDVLGGALTPEAYLAVLALATTRLAGLIALDTILDRPRLALSEAAAARRATAWVDTLITCMWCIGVWVGAAAVILAMATTAWGIAPLFEWCIIGLSLAQVAGMLSGIGRR
jgi:hypothetical protein